MRKLFFNPPRIDQSAKGSEEAWCREEVMQFLTPRACPRTLPAYALRDLQRDLPELDL
jgi:hypothetical protein